MSNKKSISEKTIEKLENSKKEILNKIAARLKDQKNDVSGMEAGHSSHSSGNGRTHSSYVSH